MGYLGRWYIDTLPTVEPVSLASLKTHLRLDTDAWADKFEAATSIAPAQYAAASSQTGQHSTVTGKDVIVTLNIGAIQGAGSLTLTIQESDDLATWSTYGSAHTYAAGSDNQVEEFSYTGDSRYVRVIGAVVDDAAAYSAVINIQTPADTVEDTYLEGLITAARMQIEEITWLALCEQTWILNLDCGFPASGEIELPRPPLSSVTSIEYVDTNGATLTLAQDQYTVLTTVKPGKVVEAYEVTWPSTRNTTNAVTIEYVCGYGSASDVPAPIQQAILMLAAHLYENREAVGTGFVMPMGVEWLLKPYMVGPRR